MLPGGRRLGGYAATTWVQLVALTVAAQLLGHSVFNVVLLLGLGIVVTAGAATLEPTEAVE